MFLNLFCGNGLYTRVSLRHATCFTNRNEWLVNAVELGGKCCGERPHKEAARPMTLADFTSLKLMIPALAGPDAPSVIQELSQALEQDQRIPELLPFYHAALNREYLAGTEMGAGMAFPHARLSTLPEVCFALGRSDAPLAWGPHAVRPVRLVFLLAVPATDATQYLLLISGLARLGSDEKLVAQLHAARDPEGLLAVLRQVELRTLPSAGTGRK